IDGAPGIHHFLNQRLKRAPFVIFDFQLVFQAVHHPLLKLLRSRGIEPASATIILLRPSLVAAQRSNAGQARDCQHLRHSSHNLLFSCCGYWLLNATPRHSDTALVLLCTCCAKSDFRQFSWVSANARAGFAHAASACTRNFCAPLSLASLEGRDVW